jgi:dolichol-phosphate mannosyltransferase
LASSTFIATHAAQSSRIDGCQLSIILPTRNEVNNIAPLLKRISQALPDVSAEIIFVDDSSDDTPKEIERLGRTCRLPVRLIARPVGQRQGGLGGAVVAGMRRAVGRWVCVMDADLQHPPEVINRLLSHAREVGADLVIASRFADGASTPGLDTMRTAISHSFILSARVLFLSRLRHVTDPLTGFFLVRREKLNLDALAPSGFKILLEMLVQFPQLVVSEIGFAMAPRNAGESKASVQEVARYFRKLIELRLSQGDLRFVQFLIVGFSGLFVNSLALMVFARMFAQQYLFAAALATQVSTSWNFALSELWVFKAKRDRSSLPLRLLGFFAINNLLLLARVPAIAALVQVANMHYVLANLATLLAVTLLRYVVADKLLWSKFSTKRRRAAAAAAPLNIAASIDAGDARQAMQ